MRNFLKCVSLTKYVFLECTKPVCKEELLDFEALVQKMSKKGVDIAPCAAINDDADAYHSPTDPG